MNSLIYSETIVGISLIEVTDFFQLNWSENKINQREKKRLFIAHSSHAAFKTLALLCLDRNKMVNK